MCSLELSAVMYFYYVYLFLPHSPTICASCFHSPQLPDVLSLYFSLWQTCITWLSLIFFFSSPSLFTRCHCCLFFFFFLNTSLLSPSDAFLSSPRRSLSPLLCLAYFRHRPPLSCFLLCVCCLFRLTLFSSKGMNPYTCQSAVEDTVHLLLPQAT